jgi:hypothetical protein
VHTRAGLTRGAAHGQLRNALGVRRTQDRQPTPPISDVRRNRRQRTSRGLREGCRETPASGDIAHDRPARTAEGCCSLPGHALRRALALRGLSRRTYAACEARSGRGPHTGFLTDTRGSTAGWVHRELQMPEDRPDHLPCIMAAMIRSVLR